MSKCNHIAGFDKLVTRNDKLVVTSVCTRCGVVPEYETDSNNSDEGKQWELYETKARVGDCEWETSGGHGDGEL